MVETQTDLSTHPGVWVFVGLAKAGIRWLGANTPLFISHWKNMPPWNLPIDVTIQMVTVIIIKTSLTCLTKQKWGGSQRCSKERGEDRERERRGWKRGGKRLKELDWRTLSWHKRKLEILQLTFCRWKRGKVERKQSWQQQKKKYKWACSQFQCFQSISGSPQTLLCFLWQYLLLAIFHPVVQYVSNLQVPWPLWK